MWRLKSEEAWLQQIISFNQLRLIIPKEHLERKLYLEIYDYSN